MSRDDSGGGSFLSFLLGAVAGATAALLLAPRSGRDTRRAIKDWLEERREKGERLLHKGEELLHKVKDELPAQKDALGAAVRAGKEAYKEAVRHNHDD